MPRAKITSRSASQSAALSNRGQRAYLSGQAAEESALRCYLEQGYLLVEHRWSGPHGEIDLILRRGDLVVFVEVKSSQSRDAAAGMIEPAQMQRVMASAAAYLDTQPRGQLTEVRLDVALVFGPGQVEIIENAFGQG